MLSALHKPTWTHTDIMRHMEETLFDILNQLKTTDYLDERTLTKTINRHNKRLLERANGAKEPQNTRPISKRRLMQYYLDVKRSDPDRWAAWQLTSEEERRLVRTLQMKPRRTASGVATITVLTKPWKCSSNCLYCPNDLRMPKSYMSDEPACQRAERTFFDPYWQVAARLKALTEMGHVTDKVELIILGGTWSDYPLHYQIWFVRELFRALNDGMAAQNSVAYRREAYLCAGLSNKPEELAAWVAPLQARVNGTTLTYNQAFDPLYHCQDAAPHQAPSQTPHQATDQAVHQTPSKADRQTPHQTPHQALTSDQIGWPAVSRWQTATWEALEYEHRINETAQHRVVGLVIETRPERVTPIHVATLRRLGCTKVQMGIQSLDEKVRRINHRFTTNEQIQQAFEALRLFGFKTHVHAMVNLMGSNPEEDKRDYQRLVTEAPYQPDEIKLYPCVLLGGTELCEHYHNGTWKPYSEEALVDVLVADTCATPPYARISRMIRDFSAPDIVAGNKKVNLRQMVESRIDSQGLTTGEIRHREVSLDEVDAETLHLDVVSYETTATSEKFLQWVTPEGKIAGFLRLSLPHKGAINALRKDYDKDVRERTALPFPLAEDEAMIREVHVYGRVAKLSTEGTSAQHRGLGSQLVETACAIARNAGYTHINVISAIGTRGYYRKLQFYDNGLYQQRAL